MYFECSAEVLRLVLLKVVLDVLDEYGHSTDVSRMSGYIPKTTVVVRMFCGCAVIARKKYGGILLGVLPEVVRK